MASKKTQERLAKMAKVGTEAEQPKPEAPAGRQPEVADQAKKVEADARRAERERKVAARRERLAALDAVRKDLVEMARRSGLKVEETKGTFKLQGGNPKQRIYILKGGAGRIDLSGFSLDLPGVTQVSEELARKMHIGNVRGIVDLKGTEPSVVQSIFARAVASLGVVSALALMLVR